MLQCRRPHGNTCIWPRRPMGDKVSLAMRQPNASWPCFQVRPAVDLVTPDLPITRTLRDVRREGSRIMIEAVPTRPRG